MNYVNETSVLGKNYKVLAFINLYLTERNVMNFFKYKKGIWFLYTYVYIA